MIKRARHNKIRFDERIQHLTNKGYSITDGEEEIVHGSNDAFEVCILERNDNEFGVFYIVYILGKNNTFESEEWGGCEFDSLDEAEEEADRLLTLYDSDVISVRKVLDKEKYERF